ncbi:GDP-mannose 4,6-dehydratase [soil metagenome]
MAGGAGFIGSHLVDRLLAEEWDVVVLDNLITGRRPNLLDAERSGTFDFLEGDVGDLADLGMRFDVIFHLASPASPVDYFQYPLETLRANSVGTDRLLQLAERSTARFVYASSSEVYGDPLAPVQSESDWGNVNPIGPRSAYDEAKRFGEAITVAHRSTHGTNAGILRLFNSYGPRMRPNDGRVVPEFIVRTLENRPLLIHGDGSQTRSFCYVVDTVDALMRMAGSDVEGPINVGHPRPITMLALAIALGDVVGRRLDLEFAAARVDDPQVRHPDIDRAKSILDWSPETSLEDGLTATVDWFSRSEAGS